MHRFQTSLKFMKYSQITNLKMSGWATEGLLTPVCTDSRPASFVRLVHTTNLTKNVRLGHCMTRTHTEGTNMHWFKASLTLVWCVHTTWLRLGHWRVLLPPICSDSRPASHLYDSYTQQTWLRLGHWQVLLPPICSDSRHKLDLQCEAGSLKAILPPICTDSGPASHSYDLYAQQTWLRMWGWATEGFLTTNMH